MKITSREIVESIVPQKAQKSEKTSGDKFGEVLKKSTESSTISRSGLASPPPAPTVPDIRFDPISSLQKTPVIEKVERFLDVLEDYQTRLGDSTTSLKDLHPLIVRMESETENLLPLLDSLPPEHEVRDILNRATIYSTVEVAKFNRGDYLAP